MASPTATPVAQPPRRPALPCERLATPLARSLPQVTGLQAQAQRPDAAGHPAHCRVQGRLSERTGRDGRRYAIQFELRLPEAWNGRFLHQANGGTDGVLVPAHGALAVLEQDALSRGFAVLSSDGGHTADDPTEARSAGLVRGVLFGRDGQARADFSHAALDALWPVAQATITRFYGQSAHHHYLAGCGNGGRLGLAAAARWPERYDGILAGAPALQWPRAALQHAWDHQLWRQLHPDPRRAFSPADLRLVAEQVVARCDALDMVTDGMVSDPRRCQQTFRLSELQCPADGTAPASAGRASTPAASGLAKALDKSAVAGTPGRCLSPEQVQALAWSFAGPHDGDGRALYTDWWFDPGIASARWRQWRIASDLTGWGGLPVAATMGAAQLAYLFSTPVQPVAGTPEALADFLASLSFDAAARAIGADPASPAVARQWLQALTPTDEPGALDAFAERGGKLLVYHGASDPAFSAQATVDLTERLQHRWGLAQAHERLRTHIVPGMGHCHGGPATDRFDALGALVDWAETGRAPERLLAQVNPDNPELPSGWRRSRSRPLCPWPASARYAGGDPEAAASFRCAMP